MSDLAAPTAVVAVDEEGAIAGQFAQVFRDLSDGEVEAAVDGADFPFVGFPDIEKGDRFGMVADKGGGLFHINGGGGLQRVDGIVGWVALGIHEAIIFVVLGRQIPNDGGIPAEGATRIRFQVEGAEVHGEGIDHEEASGKRFPGPDEPLNGLHRLEAADDPA